MSEEEAFIAYPSRWRLSLLLAGEVAFVLMGVWLIGLFGTPPDRENTWIGYVCILFFGFGIVVVLGRLVESGPEMRISKDGIYWKRWSGDTIPWSAINDVTEWHYRFQKAIILHLRDPARYRSTRYLGKVAGANRLLTGGNIAVSMVGTDKGFVEAIRAIAKFRVPNSN